MVKLEYTPFETWMRNQSKKRKNLEDQKLLDDMLLDLKSKNEAVKRKQIDGLTKELEKAKG